MLLPCSDAWLGTTYGIDLLREMCTCQISQAVRGLTAHPTEHTFASGGADNIKKFKLPRGEFLHNTLQQQRVRCCTCSGRRLVVVRHEVPPSIAMSSVTSV